MPDLRDLEMLRALAREQHFSRAASACNVTQPAFSARLRNLEAALGLPIVERGNKFRGFTREGEVILSWANRILADHRAMMQELAEMQGALSGRITVGTVPTALPFAARASAALRASHPGLIVEIVSMPSTRISRDIKAFTLDAGLTYLEDDDQAGALSLYEESYVLIAPPSLAPRKEGSARWEEAAALPLCLLSSEMRNRQIIEEVFHEIGATPELVMETNAFTAALAQVALGSAATIAPKGLAESVMAGSDAVRLDLIEPVLSHSIGLVTVQKEPPSPALSALKTAVLSSL